MGVFSDFLISISSTNINRNLNNFLLVLLKRLLFSFYFQNLLLGMIEIVKMFDVKPIFVCKVIKRLIARYCILNYKKRYYFFTGFTQ